MSVEKLVDRIYDFDGSPEEWISFERDVKKEIAGYSEKDLAYLEESDAMEHLLMICDGIRCEKGRING